MAEIRPFAALRPDPPLASRICELPYDVMSSAEAAQMAAGNPLSFLHVSKPEIDLAPETDPCAAAVYATGRQNFAALRNKGVLRQDEKPSFYLYRQVMGAHSQVGLVAVASCAEYLTGGIKKHELTRPEKEDDRVRHMEALDAQTGPVFLAYRAQAELDVLFAQKVGEEPGVDFVAKDGVRHSAWVIAEDAVIEPIREHFRRIPALYIADGHHRSAAAARVSEGRKGAGESAWFLAVIFPHDQMQILGYNRVLKDLQGQTPDEVLKRLEGVFRVEEGGDGGVTRKHELGLYLAGKWRRLRFNPALTGSGDPLETLDVALLQKHVLSPVFGIEDQRTSKRIQFVGGIRGTTELEKLVRSGEYACAFSMFPTGMEELMAVADSGGIMPPKSTWFEPKLRDAMFCHLI